MRRVRQLIPTLTMVAVAFVAGCGRVDDPPVDPVDAEPGVVAVFDGGQITVQELDDELLSRPANQRSPGGGDPGDWLEGVLGEMAVEGLLVRESERLDLGSDSDFMHEIEELRRQVTVARYIELSLPDPGPLSESDLRSLYEQRLSEYQRLPRRRVTHLFRRRGAETGDEELRTELAALRERVLAGEKLADLARELSDSQSRHQDGNLGWLTADALSAELSEILFSLEPGAPSDPIVTADGAHLFLVEEAEEGKTISFEEGRVLLARELSARRLEEAVEELAAPLQLPDHIRVAAADELAALVQAEDPEAVVLRADDYVVHLGELPLLNARAFRRSPAEPPTDVLARLERRERIYQHYRAASDAYLDRRLARIERLALATSARWHLLRELADNDDATLRSHYENHRRRFSSPLRLRVHSIEIAVDRLDDPSAAMGVLERFNAAGGADLVRFQALAERLGTTVEDHGWMTASGLGALHASWSLGDLAGLQAGESAPPLLAEGRLRLLLVTGRQEPELLPYDDVRERVRESYLAAQGQQLNAALEEELLLAAEYRVVRSELATWAKDVLDLVIDSGLD